MIGRLKQKIFYARDMWLPYLRNYAIEARVLPSHSDYTRFIILGRARTGSNFLMGLLNSHSQIIAFGEIFQNPPSIGWSLHGYSQSKQLRELFCNQPVEFVKKKVFKGFPLSIMAVGFKIFYYHAQNDQFKLVWDYLIKDNELRIIHVKRWNILRTYLSLERAFLLNKWADTTGEKVNYPPIILNYEKCLEDFTQTRDWETKYDQLFKQHEIYNLYYEDLSKDYIREMKQIQAFLGVKNENVQPRTYKQSREPLSRSILNYHELKERFSGTPWEAFFED